ncbi:MAG: GNAT family N-acetyltransferase [Caldilineaceae bacterium]|nr:GNAT family N-acetyltransferase [Caldilineaceae bacterium]
MFLSLHLNTLFIFDDGGRILSTREPDATPGPLFSLVRGPADCAWGVHADVPQPVAAELDRLAAQEPPVDDLRVDPIHAHRYVSILGGEDNLNHFAGPAFTFPDHIPQPAGVQPVEDERLLARHFRGWRPGELAEGRAPLWAVFEDGAPVSVCFCARRSDVAAEAGLETAAPFRGRGYAALVTAAWALSVRADGRIPLYSTAWDNHASRAVARKLGLHTYAANWSLSRRFAMDG